MSRPVVLLSFASILGLFAFASSQGCGSDPENVFHEDGGNGGASGASGGASNGGLGASGGASGGTSGGTSGDLGDGAACQAASSRAEKLPLTMLIALDQSGSMGNHAGYTNLTTRWQPVTAALKAFWADPGAAGIKANLRLFPHDNSKSTSCNDAAYDTPDVDLTDLPNAAPFEAKLVENPQNDFTPTRAIVAGIMKQADALHAATPDSKLAVLLVTDGEPLYCDDNDPNNDIAHALTYIDKNKYPTYVIGIGGDGTLEQNVTDLATAGGTTPIFVDDAVPANTQTALTKALDEIRKKLASCDVTIPTPPEGQSFDRNKVNVTLTTGAGQVTDLGYDPTCAGAGWKYDDPNAPTKIVLCPVTCEPVKTDPGSKVDVAFGCSTRPARVN